MVNHYNWPKYRCIQQSASSHQMAKIIFSESILFERIFTYNGGRIKHKVNVVRAARAYFSRFCLEIRLSLLSQRRCHMHFFFDVIYVFFFHVICVYFFMSCVFLCHMCNLCLRYQGGNAIDMSVNIKLTWNKYKMGMTWVLNDIKMCMTCNLSSDKRLEPPEPP